MASFGLGVEIWSRGSDAARRYYLVRVGKNTTRAIGAFAGYSNYDAAADAARAYVADQVFIARMRYIDEMMLTLPN